MQVTEYSEQNKINKRLIVSAFFIYGMKNRFISFLLAFGFIFSLSSCDSAEAPVNVTEPVKVAVSTGESSDYLAAREYCTEMGYELIEFDSREAAIISVENGVADYVIINSVAATDEYLSGFDIEYTCNTQVVRNYCAVMTENNKKLHADVNKAIDELKSRGVLDEIYRCQKEGIEYEADFNGTLEGELKIITVPVFEGLIYYDEEGYISGPEFDFIKALCNAMGVNFIVEPSDTFDDAFYSLMQGEGDILISAVEHNERRDEQFLLSSPYASMTFGIYKRKTVE